MLVDTHAHLNFRKRTEEFPEEDFPYEQYDAEIDAVLQRAHHAGVDMIVDVGDTLEDSRVSVALSEKYPELFSAVGVHPHGSNRDRLQTTIEQLECIVKSSKKVRAIGEIGLDYSRKESDPNYKIVQEKFFTTQLDIARASNLPVVIHARDAYEDIIRIIDDHAFRNLTKVIHCFTATPSVAQCFIERGCYIGFTGIVTYPKATDVAQSARLVPLSQLVVETDSPFLAPQPHRGKRNEPAYVRLVAQKIAELKKVSIEEIERATAHNAKTLFGI